MVGPQTLLDPDGSSAPRAAPQPCSCVAEAEALYRRALSAAPADVDTMFNLAELLKLRGDRAGVADMVGAITRLRPDLADNDLMKSLVSK